jgi:hypothetical protein
VQRGAQFDEGQTGGEGAEAAGEGVGDGRGHAGLLSWVLGLGLRRDGWPQRVAQQGYYTASRCRKAGSRVGGLGRQGGAVGPWEARVEWPAILGLLRIDRGSRVCYDRRASPGSHSCIVHP